MKIPMIGFAFTMTACFLMTGCSGVGVGGGSATSSNQLNTAFPTGVTMELEEMPAEGTMQRVGAGEWNVSFSEPSQLAGVRLDFQEVTASYKGLAFSVPQTALPAKSILHQFILAADQLAEESTLQGTSKDDGMVLSGDLEAGSYELTMTAEGVPAIFSMKNQNAVLTFHNFVSNGAVSESEMPAESELQTTEPVLQTESTELETTLELQE